MFLYIDPGTGSMLFTILVGLFGAGFYAVKLFLLKLKGRIGGKKVKNLDRKIPIVIYSDDKRYWQIFQPICQELDKAGIETLYLTASNDDPVLDQTFDNITAECIGKGNSSFFRLNFLSANIVLSTTPGLGVYQWKRSKKVDCYVHVPHAASDITMYRMFGIDYYDAILLSGQYQVDDVRKLEELRNLKAKELVKVGIPYMDVMAQRAKDATVLEKDPQQKTVLLAPSWGKSALFSVYGDKILRELQKTGYNIIVRPHPQSFESEKELMEKLMKDFPESDKLQWNRDKDNFEVLRRSDIMVSDFSGVIFDFALIFGRPIIYTNPQIDVSPYDVWWLKQDPWATSVLSKIGQELTEGNIHDMKGLIDSCLTETKYAQGITQLKQEAWEHFGEGAKNVVNYLVNKYNEISAAKTDDESQEKTEKPKKKFFNKKTIKEDK